MLHQCSVSDCYNEPIHFYVHISHESAEFRCRAHQLRSFDTFGGTWRRLNRKEYDELKAVMEIMES